MAELNVEKSENNDWWKWVLGLLVLALIAWLIFDNVGSDDDVDEVYEDTKIESHLVKPERISSTYVELS